MPSGQYERTPELIRAMVEKKAEYWTEENGAKAGKRTQRQINEDPEFQAKAWAGLAAWWAVPANRAKRQSPPGEAGFNNLYRRYKGAAKWRKLEFSLTREDVRILTSGRCTYCGAVPSQIAKRNGSEHSTYLYNGMDRVDNNIGYVISNVVTSCGRCNSIKRAMTKREFASWIDTVYNHYVLPNKEKS
jgi:hypothetical protein